MEEAIGPLRSVPTTRDTSFLLPFRIDAERLGELHEAFRRFGNEVAYTLVCADGFTRQLDFAGLKSYANSNSQAIKSLQVLSPPTDGRFASVTFRDEDFESVEIHCTGPEREVLELSGAIDRFLDGAKPWYSWLAKHSIWQLGAILAMAVLLLMTLFSLSLSVLVRVGVLPQFDVFTVNDLAIRLNLILGFAVTYTFALSLVEYCRIGLFPVGTFAIGAGRKRYWRMECWRWAIAISLLVGIAVGFAAVVVHAAAPLHHFR